MFFTMNFAIWGYIVFIPCSQTPCQLFFEVVGTSIKIVYLNPIDGQCAEKMLTVENCLRFDSEKLEEFVIGIFERNDISKVDEPPEP